MLGHRALCETALCELPTLVPAPAPPPPPPPAPPIVTPTEGGGAGFGGTPPFGFVVPPVEVGGGGNTWGLSGVALFQARLDAFYADWEKCIQKKRRKRKKKVHELGDAEELWLLGMCDLDIAEDLGRVPRTDS